METAVTALPFLVLAVITQLCIPCLAAPGPVIDTNYGKVQGKYTDKAQVFTSIPYATAPVGTLRWKDPRPPTPWPGILSVMDDPPGCPQSVPCGLPLPSFTCPKRVSEDCLYLNVFAPLNAGPSTKLPVMVFIHGGNFLRGYSGGYLYDGQYVVNTSSTVVVTINYRLGAIGFLVYGRQTGSDAISGNYGFKDQRMALEWIRDNIAGFGGDPNDVTLWGQSAGAISIAIHMTTIRSSGLFHKAILESEPFGIALKRVSEAEKLGKDFAKEIGCESTTDTACLFSKSVAEIASAQNAVLTKIINPFHIFEVFLQWTPILDGEDIIDQPLTLFRKGEAATIPMIIGTTSQETVFFIYEAFPKPMPPYEYDALLLAIFTIHSEEVHQHYPTPTGDTRPITAVIGTDETFTCPTRYAVRGFVEQVAAPVWLYVFNHSSSFGGWGKNYSFCDGHSCHGVELPYVFHTATLGGFNYSKDELVLAHDIIDYWTNFAHTGNPNGGQSLMLWPPYDGSKTGECMRFKTPASDIISNYRGDNCDFLDSVGYQV